MKNTVPITSIIKGISVRAILTITNPLSQIAASIQDIAQSFSRVSSSGFLAMFTPKHLRTYQDAPGQVARPLRARPAILHPEIRHVQD